MLHEQAYNLRNATGIEFIVLEDSNTDFTVPMPWACIIITNVFGRRQNAPQKKQYNNTLFKLLYHGEKEKEKKKRKRKKAKEKKSKEKTREKKKRRPTTRQKPAFKTTTKTRLDTTQSTANPSMSKTKYKTKRQLIKPQANVRLAVTMHNNTHVLEPIHL